MIGFERWMLRPRELDSNKSKIAAKRCARCKLSDRRVGRRDSAVSDPMSVRSGYHRLLVLYSQCILPAFCLTTGRPGHADAPSSHVVIAMRRQIGWPLANLLLPCHREGPRPRAALPVSYSIRRRPATRAALVNRRLRHADLDVVSEREPEAVRLGHDELNHPNLDAVRRLDNSVEPERSQPDDVKPRVRWHVIADVRESGDVETDEHRAVIAEGQGSADV